MEIAVCNKYHGTVGEYIGRGSPLGNPFKIGRYTREQVIEKYEEWLREKINNSYSPVCDEMNRLYYLAEKQPINLICFCSPKLCHGNIIKEILLEKFIERKGKELT